MKCGDWISTAEGVEYIGEPFIRQTGHGYFISAERFHDEAPNYSWLQHLRDKVWFREKIERDFLEAYFWMTYAIASNKRAVNSGLGEAIPSRYSSDRGEHVN